MRYAKPSESLVQGFITGVALILLMASLGKLFALIFLPQKFVGMDLVLPFLGSRTLTKIAIILDSATILTLLWPGISANTRLSAISLISTVFLGYKTSLLLNFGIIKCNCFGGSPTKRVWDVALLVLPILMLLGSLLLQFSRAKKRQIDIEGAALGTS